jgi:BolA family transcriptional regulator, general stress-responsive regulator
MSEARINMIKTRLTEALHPESLQVIDDSHKHRGHAGAKDGRGHFNVIITASTLSGLSRIEQHQKIYAALGTLMQSDIHALSLKIN